MVPGGGLYGLIHNGNRWGAGVRVGSRVRVTVSEAFWLELGYMNRFLGLASILELSTYLQYTAKLSQIYHNAMPKFTGEYQ